MFNRWFILALLALQLLPALALVPGQSEAMALEIDHAWVHQSGQGHHHDAALTVGFDDGDAPRPHAHHDAGQHAALPLDIPALRLPNAQACAGLTFPGPRRPDPHLEGPLRPPRSAA
jgi:hypothetical protein